MKIHNSHVHTPNLTPPKPRKPHGSPDSPSAPKDPLSQAADKLQENDSSDATKLLKQGSKKVDEAGLQAPELDQVAKVAKDIEKVAHTTAKLKSQVEGIHSTVAGYLTEVRDTATGPYHSMKAHIEETRDRIDDPNSPIPALRSHVQERIDELTGPVAKPVTPPDVVKIPVPGAPPIPVLRVNPELTEFVREEVQWVAGWTTDTAGRLGDQARWMADWTRFTVDSVKHLGELVLAAPSVARDVIDQTKAAIDTAQTLARQVQQLQEDLEKLSDQTGASPYVPSVTSRRV